MNYVRTLRNAVLILLLTVVVGSVAAGSPPCRKAYQAETWTNCVGEKKFANGLKYVGEFRNGAPNGRGTYTFPSGAKYVGEFKNGKYDGQGTLTLPSGTQYVGEFMDGKYDGSGTLTLGSGEKYIGEWRDDQLVGQVTLALPSGVKYIGGIKDGKPDGQGIEYRADGSIRQSGTWKDGVFKGAGR